MILTAAELYAQGNAPTTADQVRPLVEKALQQVAESDHVLVDPRISAKIVDNVAIFASNFCFPPDSDQGRSNCDRTVNDPQVLTGAVDSFLTEIVSSRPSQLESVGSRLAHALNKDFRDIGWPSQVENSAGVVDLPQSWQSAEISYSEPSGNISLGSSGRVLLLNPGTIELIAHSDPTTDMTQQLAISPRQRISFTQTVLANTSAIGPIEPDVADFCPITPSSRITGAPGVDPLQRFNWGRATFAESADVRNANDAPFTTQPFLDIRVVNDTDQQCGSDCLLGLGAAFAEAIAVWREGCGRCDANALSVLRLTPTVWVDARIASRLRNRVTGEQATTNLNLGARTVDELQSAPRVEYEQLSGNDELLNTLCSIDSQAAPWVSAAQNFVCDASKPLPQAEMHPVLTLKSGDTQCGLSKDFIACGLPNQGIELTLNDVRYTIPTAQGQLALSSSASGLVIPIRHVILHEVGHWFGVPHAEVEGRDFTRDIMGQRYGEGQFCVSSESMTMMNNAADLRWPFRAKDNQGLRRPLP